MLPTQQMVRAGGVFRMNRETNKRILQGLGANAYGQLAVIAVQLAGVPILLHAWGAQLYGEWLILSAIPAYLSLTDLGFSQSAANDMTARVARGDLAGTLAVFQSLTVLVYSAAVLGLLLVTLLLWLLPTQGWLHAGVLSPNGARWVLWFLAVEVLVKLADGVNHAGFRSHGDYALHVACNYSTLLLQFGAVWGLAIAGYGPVAAAASFAVIRIAVTPILAIVLLMRHCDLRVGLTHASRKELGALVKPATANILIPLSMAVNTQGMVLVVAATLGSIAVVTFSTLRTLSRLVLQLGFQTAHSFEPELAAAWGRHNQASLKQLYLNALRLSFWVTFPAVLFLLVLGPWILRVWTHNQVVMDPWLFRWLLLSALAGTVWYGGLTLLKAANQHFRATLWCVLSAGAALVLAAIGLHVTHRLAVAGGAMLLMDTLVIAYLTKSAASLIGAGADKLLLGMLDVHVFVRVLNKKLFNTAE